MEPIFTDKQLNNMSREDLISLMRIVQEKQTKKEGYGDQLLKDKQKNSILKCHALWPVLPLHRGNSLVHPAKRSMPKAMNEWTCSMRPEASAGCGNRAVLKEIRPSSYKRKRKRGKKEEDLSILRLLRPGPINWKEARYCPDAEKYSVVTKETVKTLPFLYLQRTEVEESHLCIQLSRNAGHETIRRKRTFPDPWKYRYALPLNRRYHEHK